MGKNTLMEKVFRDQVGKLKETYALLQKVMPPYFFKSVSEEELTSLLTMATDLESKSGIQMIERPDQILMVYWKSEACNPVYKHISINI